MKYVVQASDCPNYARALYSPWAILLSIVGLIIAITGNFTQKNALVTDLKIGDMNPKFANGLFRKNGSIYSIQIEKTNQKHTSISSDFLHSLYSG
jgi:hypothetical protein